MTDHGPARASVGNLEERLSVQIDDAVKRITKLVEDTVRALAPVVDLPDSPATMRTEWAARHSDGVMRPITPQQAVEFHQHGQDVWARQVGHWDKVTK